MHDGRILEVLEFVGRRTVVYVIVARFRGNGATLEDVAVADMVLSPFSP